MATGANGAGASVGWYLTSPDDFKIAAFWPAGSLASGVAAVDLGAWEASKGPAKDLFSAASSINGGGWIVGWSGNGSSSPVRAVLKRAASSSGKTWQDLNDKRFVHASTGWVLKEATAINEARYIVGNRIYGNLEHGFILVPRNPGN